MPTSRALTLCGLLVLSAVAVGAYLFQGKSPDSSHDSSREAVRDSRWPEPYAFLHRTTLIPASREYLAAPLPFDRVELERTPCFGFCPTYTISLSRDGSARYVGHTNVPRVGTFVGAIDLDTYARVCYLLAKCGFGARSVKFAAPWTCQATSYLRTWRAGQADPVVITDYGSWGPIELWSLLQTIDCVTASIKWKPAR